MKRLLLEYQVFLSHIDEIYGFLTKVDKNVTIEKISNAIVDLDAEKEELLSFIQQLGGSTLVYNAIIISLYGCLENYIDKLLGVYLEILTENKNTYEDLPEKLRDKYRNKLGEFLSSPQRFANMELDLAQEVSKYNELIHSNVSGTINKNLALAHSGNLHFNEICLLMTHLGIKDAKTKIIDCSIFKEYHINHGMDEMEYDAKRARRIDDFFIPIEQLITQRNSVAHSWNVEDRVSLREIKTIVLPFVKMLCECILRVCVVEAFMLNPSQSMFKDEKPINVFHNQIVCLNNQNVKVALNDCIIYTSGADVKIARIKNIQVDGSDIDSVQETEAKNIGVKLDNRIQVDDKIKLIIHTM